MHEIFQQLLPDATGDSELVIALFWDVRGYSSFSERVESVEAALYIKRIYDRALTYFEDVSFFKPTGDGLMIIFSVDETNLETRANAVVASALQLVKDFPNLVTDDPLINFDVPDRLGIGIARGAACRLTSDGRTLDYSGRVLNLAARLMDLARPAGIVIDRAFRIELLDNSLRARFADENVYIRSVAESEPRPVHVLDGVTEVPQQNRRPLDVTSWHTQTAQFPTIREMRESGPAYLLELNRRPLAPSNIAVRVATPAVTAGGRRHATLWDHQTVDEAYWEYFEEAGVPHVALRLADILDNHVDAGARGTWPIMLRIIFPES